MQMPNVKNVLTPQQNAFNADVLVIYERTAERLKQKGVENRKVLDDAVVRIFGVYVDAVHDGSDQDGYDMHQRVLDLYPSFRLAQSRLMDAYGKKPLTFGRDTKLPSVTSSVKRALRLFREHQSTLFPNQNELPYVQILLDRLL